MTVYAKPTVRSSWAQTAGGADLVDPGDTYAKAGYLIGVKPPRQYVNWQFNWVFNAVRYFCQQGVSDWDVLESYAVNAITQASDNRLYQAIQASTGVNPVGGTAGFWGPVQGATPANTDHTNSLATTAWVNTNYLAAGSGFSVLAGSIANAQVPVGAVTQWQASLSLTFPQIIGTIANAQVPVGTVTQWQGSLSIAWGQITGTKNADQLGGLAGGPIDGYTPNTYARYNSSGYLYANYFNQSSSNNENPAVSQVMVTNGVDNYMRKCSLAQLIIQSAALLPSDFPSLLAVSGYQKLINGVIIQWGSAAISGNTTITYPTGFPSACRSVVITPVNSTNQFFISAVGSNNFTVSNGTATVYWIAIGY